MDREPIEVTRADRIYCLNVSSDYHSEVCEECKYYPNCDHMTQDDMTEVTIKDLQKLEQIARIVADYDGSAPSMIKQFSEIQKVLEQE